MLQLEQLKPGARIVSHRFALPGFSVDQVVKADSPEDGTTHALYLWTSPLKQENQ